MPPPRNHQSEVAASPAPCTSRAKLLELMGKCASAICFCDPFGISSETDNSSGSAAPASPRSGEAHPERPRRHSWYSVLSPNAKSDDVFMIRAIANPQEHGPCSIQTRVRACSFLPKDVDQQVSKLDDDDDLPKRAKSVPEFAERHWGVDNDREPAREDILCRLCCSEAADVILLPCRHGGLCYHCFRRLLFIRPLHKGGSTCPICRRQIREAVRINEKELQKPLAVVHYGIGIDAILGKQVSV